MEDQEVKLALGALVVMAGVAHADEKLVPTAVAVSSTVDNVNIKPDHLIDGRMDTAWNSVTGEEHAWVAIRVPIASHVTAIKMTVGFTAIDKKLGDLFTQNTRIKHVYVMRNGANVGEFDLHEEDRELQTLKVDGQGGDFQVVVTTTQPGTKRNWREIAISELEIWGTPAPAEPTAKKPAPLVVRVGSLDAGLVLTKPECKRAMGPASNPIVDEDQIYVSDALTLCRRTTQAKKDTASTTTLALVDRRSKKLIQTLPGIDVNNGVAKETDGYPEGSVSETGAVSIETIPLTTTERAIIVKTESSIGGPMMGGHHDKRQWYRASSKGLTKIHETTSSDYGTEEDESDRCEIVPFTVGTSVPKQLIYECVHTTTDWHDEDQSKQGSFDEERKDRYKWNGAEYVKL